MDMNENKRRRSMMLYVLIAIIAYLAISQALGNAACRQGIPTRYTRLQDMLEQIDRARLDGQDEYYRKVDEFKTIQLLILDDFLTTPITAADSVLIFEIMETRNGTGTTLIASQCEPEQWYVRSGSELIADSTLSRLTGSARYLELEGPDMRRRNTTLSEEKGWKEVTAGTNE